MTQITHGRGKYQTLMKFVKFFLKQSNFYETRNSSVTQPPLELEPTISPLPAQCFDNKTAGMRRFLTHGLAAGHSENR